MRSNRADTEGSLANTVEADTTPPSQQHPASPTALAITAFGGRLVANQHQLRVFDHEDRHLVLVQPGQTIHILVDMPAYPDPASDRCVRMDLFVDGIQVVQRCVLQSRLGQRSHTEALKSGDLMINSQWSALRKLLVVARNKCCAPRPRASRVFPEAEEEALGTLRVVVNECIHKSSTKDYNTRSFTSARIGGLLPLDDVDCSAQEFCVDFVGHKATGSDPKLSVCQPIGDATLFEQTWTFTQLADIPKELKLRSPAGNFRGYKAHAFVGSRMEDIIDDAEVITVATDSDKPDIGRARTRAATKKADEVIKVDADRTEEEDAECDVASLTGSKATNDIDLNWHKEEERIATLNVANQEAMLDTDDPIREQKLSMAIITRQRLLNKKEAVYNAIKRKRENDKAAGRTDNVAKRPRLAPSAKGKGKGKLRPERRGGSRRETHVNRHQYLFFEAY